MLPSFPGASPSGPALALPSACVETKQCSWALWPDTRLSPHTRQHFHKTHGAISTSAQAPLVATLSMWVLEAAFQGVNQIGFLPLPARLRPLQTFPSTQEFTSFPSPGPLGISLFAVPSTTA